MGRFEFLPLADQIDYGFGVTGEAFYNAAERLKEAEGTSFPLSYQHLPTTYLYRHSCELFLKSIIIVVHRSLEIPFGDHDHNGSPSIQIDGRWSSITSTHSVRKLYNYFRSVTKTYKTELSTIAKTDWGNPPENLGRAIELMDEMDSCGTVCRYPQSKNTVADLQKSSFKEVDPCEISEAKFTEGKPIKAFLIVNDADDIEAGYLFDDSALSAFGEAARDASSILSGGCYGIRMELVGGKW